MKRILMFSLILSFFSKVYSLDNFDECGELYNLIKEETYKLSLDEPDIRKEKMSGIFLKWDLNEMKLERTLENNIILESLHPEVYEKFQIEPNTTILELNHKKVRDLNDDEIEKELENKDIIIKFYEQEIQLLEKEYDVQYVLVNFETREIDQIDSKLSRYKVSFLHTLVWDDQRITKLGRRIYEKAKKFDSKLKKEDWTYFCQYKKEKFQDLDIYEPDIIIANKVSLEGDSTEILYELDFMPNFFDDGSDYLEIRKEIDGIGTFKSNFDFKSFPFDSQKIIFKFQSNSNNLSATYRTLPYFSPYTIEELIRGFENLKMQEWEKISIGYDYFYVKDVGADTYQVGITYITNIERNYMYFLSKVYLPIIIILLVSWSVFWINPKEIEARLTVSIVCLLSLIAYTFIVDKDLPKLSYLTIMDLIILLSYFFSSIPTIGSIYIYRYLNDSIKVKRINDFFKFFVPILYISSFVLVCILIIGESPNTIAALKFYRSN